MVLQLKNNTFHYELEKLTRSFFPDRKVQVQDDGAPETPSEDGIRILAELTDDAASVTYSDSNQTISNSELVSHGDNTEHAMARALWHTLSQVTGLSPKWGILTGIRPSKLLNQLTEDVGREEARRLFGTEYLVSPEKTELAATVADAEEEILSSSTDDSYSLYIGIPFCPNRCSYCSFVSQSIDRPNARKLMAPYVDTLLKELEADAQIANDCGLKLRSVYVGGGTPSTLSAEQIQRLLKTVQDNFDFTYCTEFTFEAGRPDTITEDKLRAILEGGVDRISINPQTMSDEVLSRIGRKHTAQEIMDSFAVARSLGFSNINMDLIAGLPGDTVEGFAESLEKVLSLDPESVTVHTVAYKRSADWDATKELFSRGEATAKMIDIASDLLYNHSYAPYYMYRQARSVGNLENVGWAKPGFESAYNVYMMEEKHTIFACGAGAVSKLVRNGEITRVANHKYPFEYISRFDEILDHKNQYLDFYGR